MRIAFLNANGELGGAERSLLDLMASMGQLREAPEMRAILGADGPLRSKAEAAGVQVTLAPIPAALGELGDSSLEFGGRFGAALSLAVRAGPAALATRRYVSRLRKVLRDVEPSLVHSNDNKSHILASLATRGSVPVIWHVRDFVGARAVMARGLRWCSSRAAAAIAISEAVQRDIRRILPSLPVSVVYNAIDLDLFSPGPGDGRLLDELAGMPVAETGTVRIGLVATFGRWKGQDLFLEAAALALSSSGFPRSRPVRFYVIGGPIYRTKGSQFATSELKKMASEREIDDKVGFVCFQENVAPLYRALDVVVHASVRPEPFGRTIVEAMACAKPVAVSRAGGSVELFEHGKDAIGFTPGSAADLAATIKELALDDELRARIGQNARKTALRRFSRERLGREVMSAYSRAVGGGGPSDETGGVVTSNE
jgi:glycosyltransferase involved in cell wall biosynthesis